MDAGTNGNGATPPFTTETIPPSPETPRVTRLSDLVGELAADAEARHQAYLSGLPRGPRSGIASIDHAISGAYEVGTHVVHGNTGSGKTALCWQICASSPFPALFISCEMAPRVLLWRQAARVTSTYLNKFKTGELPPAQAIALLRQGAAAAPFLTLADATTAYADPEWIEKAAKVARGDSEHFMVVVDSLHSWVKAAPSGMTEYDALGGGLLALQRLAHRLNAPILYTAERNRASMEKGGANSGAGHRGIEYGAETVMGLTKKKDGPKLPQGESRVTATFEKNRHGDTDKEIPLIFSGGFMRFTEAGA